MARRQEFFTAPASNVYKLKPETDLYEAALIEPLACAIRGWDVLPRRMGDHVLVYGSGTMGLLMAQLATRAGAATVTIVDLNEERLATAGECGIELRYTSADDADREKWDVVIDCTGNIRAIEDALTRVKPAGFFQDFGVAPADRTAQFSPFRIYRDEISIVGTMAVLNSFGRAVELFEAGAINAKAMISHSFTLDDYDRCAGDVPEGRGAQAPDPPQRHRIAGVPLTGEHGDSARSDPADAAFEGCEARNRDRRRRAGARGHRAGHEDRPHRRPAGAGRRHVRSPRRSARSSSRSCRRRSRPRGRGRRPWRTRIAADPDGRRGGVCGGGLGRARLQRDLHRGGGRRASRASTRWTSTACQTDLLVRVQTGPAINGTELRDATGEITFGQLHEPDRVPERRRRPERGAEERGARGRRHRHPSRARRSRSRARSPW